MGVVLYTHDALSNYLLNADTFAAQALLTMSGLKKRASVASPTSPTSSAEAAGSMNSLRRRGISKKLSMVDFSDQNDAFTIDLGGITAE
jgi:hypothetical protein